MPSHLDPGIFVHANIGEKPITFRAMQALGISQDRAVGMLVMFWGKAAQNTDGNIAPCTDDQIEMWGGWKGKRGKFAAFVRRDTCDADGWINEWDEWGGKLSVQRAKDRDRKRNVRGMSADKSRNVRDQPTQSPVIEREYREESKKEPLFSSPAVGDFDFTEPRVAAFFGAVPEQKHSAWKAILPLWAHGERWGAGRKPTVDDIAAGLAGAVTAHDGHGMSEAYVRGCIRSAMRPEPTTPDMAPNETPAERVSRIARLTEEAITKRGAA